jgi:outer membrane immunogenic protein
MKKFLVAGIATAALCGAPAIAADMPVKAPVYKAAPTPIFNWTGFYIGGHVGYGWSKVDNLYGPLAGPGAFTSDGGKSDGKGWLGGVHAGYNVQNGNLVWGFELDGDYTGIKGDDHGVGGDTNQFKAPWLASARLRAGVVTMQRTLWYVTGGGAYMRGEADALNVVGQPTVGRNLWGWTVGGGVEYALTNNWIGRIEYRYSDFGHADFPLAIAGYTQRSAPTLQTVTAGISYKY